MFLSFVANVILSKVYIVLYIYQDCVDEKDRPNHIMIIHVYPSTQLCANQADEVFYRVGDKSKKMNFEQRTRLMYAKGNRYFENVPVRDAVIDDIDLDFVKEYTTKIGYGKGPLEYLCSNKDFIVTRNGQEEISSAAVLLFGKNPQRFFSGRGCVSSAMMVQKLKSVQR